MHVSADSKIRPAEKSSRHGWKPHAPRTTPTHLVARPRDPSGHILAEVALRRKQHKHNAVEPVDHTRRTYARVHVYSTHAHTHVEGEKERDRIYAAHVHTSRQRYTTPAWPSVRRDIALRRGRKMPAR